MPEVPQGVTTVGEDRDRPAGGGGDGIDPGTGSGGTGGYGGSGEDPEDPNGLIDATDTVKDATVTVTDVVGGLLAG
jgi:hypothetical protein